MLFKTVFAKSFQDSHLDPLSLNMLVMYLLKTRKFININANDDVIIKFWKSNIGIIPNMQYSGCTSVSVVPVISIIVSLPHGIYLCPLLLRGISVLIDTSSAIVL
jgi:hypothetical protein